MNRLPITFLLACAFALAGCNNHSGEEKAAAPAPTLQGKQFRFPADHPQLTQLHVTAAKPAQALAVDMPARLVWNEDRTQRIYAAFAGRVARIGADLGQPVKPGTVLAQLASPDFGVAQADTAKARADAALAQKGLARQRELFEAGVVARKELDQAETEAARTQAEVQRAEARTRLYGAAAGGSVDQRLGLVTGIGGLVVERNITPGQELRPDQSGPGVPPLFVVSDPTSLWVLIDARETEVGALRPGGTFQLVVPSLPGEKFEGKVLAASDFIDPSTRSIKVRGLVANPQRKLKAEMLATARIERHPGEGVFVPAGAVLLQGGRQTVFVQVQAGAFEPREVDIGWQGPSEVLVTRGLAPGEQVVTENTLMLARQYATLKQDKGAGPAATAATAQGEAPRGAATQ